MNQSAIPPPSRQPVPRSHQVIQPPAGQPIQRGGARNELLSLSGKVLCHTKLDVRERLLIEERVDMLHEPDTPEILRMLVALRRLYPQQRQVAAILGIPVTTLTRWECGHHHPPRGARRGVWLTWCLHFAPWKLRTSFDLLTWGRYARPEKGEKPPN